MFLLKYTNLKKFRVNTIFVIFFDIQRSERSRLCSPKQDLFEQKYSNSNEIFLQFK